MSTYRFSGNSTIAEARFHAVPGHAPMAMLTARDGAGATSLIPLRHQLEMHGWQCVPVFASGKDALQVGGFKEPADLTAFLRTQHMIEGEPDIRLEERDAAVGTKNNWLRYNGLKLAGWFNFVGDVSLLAAGIKAKDKLMQLGGGFYTVGALTLGRYGNVKPERQLAETAEDTALFLSQQNITLPQQSGLAHAVHAQQNDVFHNTEKFLYRHPADIMLGAYSAGAAAMLASGIKEGRKERIGYGVWSLGVKVLSLLITEKKTAAPGQPKVKSHTIFTRIADWFHEKPLRLYGYGSMVTELWLGASAVADLKSANPDKRKSAIFGFITTGMYVLADVLMAISHKNPSNTNGKFSADEQLHIEALAAETIAAQPDSAARTALTSKVGAFLARRSQMSGSQAEITQAVRTQVEHLGNSRWVSRTAAEAAPVTEQVR